MRILFFLVFYSCAITLSAQGYFRVHNSPVNFIPAKVIESSNDYKIFGFIPDDFISFKEAQLACVGIEKATGNVLYTKKYAIGCWLEMSIITHTPEKIILCAADSGFKGFHFYTLDSNLEMSTYTYYPIDSNYYSVNPIDAKLNSSGDIVVMGNYRLNSALEEQHLKFYKFDTSFNVLYTRDIELPGFQFGSNFVSLGDSGYGALADGSFVDSSYIATNNFIIFVSDSFYIKDVKNFPMATGFGGYGLINNNKLFYACEASDNNRNALGSIYTAKYDLSVGFQLNSSKYLTQFRNYREGKYYIEYGIDYKRNASILVAGTKFLGSAGNATPSFYHIDRHTQIMVAELDTADVGVHWEKYYGNKDGGFFYQRHCLATADSGSLVVGTHYGWDTASTTNLNFFVLKVDTGGNILTAQQRAQQLSASCVIYPNPASSYLEVRGNFRLPATFELYDISGKRVKQVVFTGVSSSGVVNLEDIGVSGGVYQYRLVSADNKTAFGSVVLLPNE